MKSTFYLGVLTIKSNKLAVLCIMFTFLLLSSAFAFRYNTIVVLNDLFVDFSIHSDLSPYWINDSEIVHKGGRIEVEENGKYFLSNAKSYYDILYRTQKSRADDAWRRKYNGDFEQDIVKYYENRQPLNVSHYFGLKNYWEKRKSEVFGNKQ